MEGTPQDSVRTTTIRGHVIADDRNEDDEVIAVAITTADEEEYVVENGPQGHRLAGHVNDLVEASGVVRTDRHGRKNIRVTGFEVLDLD